MNENERLRVVLFEKKCIFTDRNNTHFDMATQAFEKKMKHLEFVQGAITRMSSNSFSMKGWMITILAAFLAVFAGSKDLNELYLFIAIIPTLLFWILDSYYLLLEKKYRRLFDDVIADIKTDFDMNANAYYICFCKVMLSKTEWPLYLIIIVMLLISGLLGCAGVY